MSGFHVFHWRAVLECILSFVSYRVLLLLVVFHQDEVNVHNDLKQNVSNKIIIITRTKVSFFTNLYLFSLSTPKTS